MSFPVVIVPASRMAWEPWDHARDRDGKRGDINAAYSADRIAMQGTCKTFVHDGELYTNVGGCLGCKAYRLVERKHYRGELQPHKYGERDRTEMWADELGTYNGLLVKSGKTQYVMVGPEIHFHALIGPALQESPLSLFELEPEPEPDEDEPDYERCEECGEPFESCECSDTICNDCGEEDCVCPAVESEPEPEELELEDVQPVSVEPFTEQTQLSLF